MVNRGKNHLGIDRSKTAGGRARRKARERKKALRDANLYKISVRSSVASKSRYDNKSIGVYGVYKEGSKWYLTAMAVRRTEERLVSDRRGGTESEVKDEVVVAPSGEFASPRDGLVLGSYSTKKGALSDVSASTSTKVRKGEYIVRPGEWDRSMKTHKVDRGEYRDWKRARSTKRVR